MKKNVQGPRSALTDFLQESGINLRKSTLFHKRRGGEQLVSEHKAVKPKKVKQVKTKQPTEMVNQNSEYVVEDAELNRLFQNRENHVFTPDQTKALAMYFSRTRQMTQHTFDFLVDNSHDELFVYDCSNIKHFAGLLNKSLRTLELHLCGKLTADDLNEILANMKDLEHLKITGAFLLEDIFLPSTLKSLNLEHCSRLTDVLIDRINRTFTHLETLNISKCYNITGKTQLMIDVDHLSISELTVDESFYNHIKELKALDINRCCNINVLPKNTHLLHHLDVEGVTSLQELGVSDCIKYLNIAYCYNVKDFYHPKLEYLNVAYLELNESEIRGLTQLSRLKVLDISWNNCLNDELLELLVGCLELDKIHVFGCFSLTKKSVQFALENTPKTKTIGHPCETEYLLDHNNRY